MRPYINFYTDKRKESTNESDKNFLKLMKNSVSGKTMENLRKRVKIRVVKNENDIAKNISRPTYVNHSIYGKKISYNSRKKDMLSTEQAYICWIYSIRNK